MLINRRIFFNEQIPLRHVSFRLIVVVVANEILDCILRKEITKLAIQLRGQCFVGREHNRRATQPGDHIRHGECLTRAGYTEQGLERQAIAHAFHQLLNRRRLITGGLEGLVQAKRRVGESDELGLVQCGLDLSQIGHAVGTFVKMPGFPLVARSPRLWSLKARFVHNC